MKKWIIVRTSFIGFHDWPAAPDEVAFLRNNHRHVFEVRLWLEVFHNERELEFFIIQRRLNKFIESIEFNSSASCEQMAETILERFSSKYEIRDCKVEVSEDGENAALVESK